MSNRSDEIWKPIPGLPISYEVSNIGNVREVVYGENPRILHKSKSKNKLFVSIKGKQYPVHRLVAVAFVIDPDDRDKSFLVIHKDKNLCNNRADNLEYVLKADHISSMIYSNRYHKIYCKEIDRRFVSIRSASYFTAIPPECIENSLKSGDKCFGYHFSYIEDETESGYTYINKSDMVANSLKYNSISDYLSENS